MHQSAFLTFSIQVPFSLLCSDYLVVVVVCLLPCEIYEYPGIGLGANTHGKGFFGSKFEIISVHKIPAKIAD